MIVRFVYAALLVQFSLTALILPTLAQERSSDQVRTLVIQAHDMTEKGDNVSAARLLKQACELDPSSSSVHGMYGGVLCQLGQYDQSIVEIRKAIDLGANQGYVWSMLGATYAKQGDLKASANAFEEYLLLEPNGPQAPMAKIVIDIFAKEGTQGNGLRAMNLEDQGGKLLARQDFTGAAPLLKQACDLEPSVAGLHCNYGFCLVKLNRNDEAQVEFQKTIDLDKNVAEAWRNIGTVYKMKGDFKTAQADYEEYLRLAPTAPDAPVIRSLISAMQH